MDNPIPSAMVYFDEKQRRAVLCLDESLPPPAVVEACTNSSEEHGFHTHTWLKRGWMSETAFMTDRPRTRDLAAHFVHDVLFCINKVREDFDRMQHEHNEVMRINEKLEGVIRNNIAAMRQAMLHIEFEEERLKLAREMVNAESRVLSRDEGPEKGN
jgi:hypothetical protein